MAKKTFKEKEQAFLASNKVAPESGSAIEYVQQKRTQDKAFEMLKEQGFNVFFKDSILHCECKDNAEYDAYKNLLLENFGQDEKVSFSFGATIKEYEEMER